MFQGAAIDQKQVETNRRNERKNSVVPPHKFAQPYPWTQSLSAATFKLIILGLCKRRSSIEAESNAMEFELSCNWVIGRPSLLGMPRDLGNDDPVLEAIFRQNPREAWKWRTGDLKHHLCGMAWPRALCGLGKCVDVGMGGGIAEYVAQGLHSSIGRPWQKI